MGHKEADILTVFVDLCYKNECPQKGLEGIQQPINKNVIVFKLIVVKNVISSQVTGLFALKHFYTTSIVKLLHD